ncbi:MAG: ubiquitin-like domain-containing protein [Micrococcales bacterium]|nr:ubiquitin-like domain-containing protein [Micrococcales bacterium]
MTRADALSDATPTLTRAEAGRARRRARKARRVRFAARVAVLSLLCGGIGVFAVVHRNVTIEVDGVKTSTSTLAKSVGQVLNDQGIVVSAHDIVAPGVDEAIPRDGEIVVRRARALDLSIDGKPQRVWTTEPTVEAALAEIGVRAQDVALSVNRSAAVSRLDHPVRIQTPKTVTVEVDGVTITEETTAATVGEALSDLGVVLSAADQVSVDLDAQASDGQTLVVDRAQLEDGQRTETTKFKTITKEDPSLFKGEKKVVKKGRVGERVITYKATTVAGDTVAEEVLAEVVLSKPQNKVVHVGTKEPPRTPSGRAISVPNVNINVSPSSAKGIARGMVKDDTEFRCLVALWDRESGWKTTAANRYSGAYGIPQALPGSKMASAGSDWQTNPKTQIKWGLGYIKGRYGTPCGAWSAFQSKGWY